MRRMLNVALALFMLLPAFAEEVSDARVREILQERIDAGKTVGMVVGLIDANGPRIIPCGRLGTGSTAPLAGGDSFYEIGSITKAFTGVLLAEAVRRGEVNLDDPISKHLPATVKVPERNGKQITLLNLSNHTSALPRLPDNFRPADPANPYADYSVQQMYEFLSKHELRRDIGEKYEYSNLGVGLLGHILALKAGLDYETLVRTRICAPLQMTDTRIVLSPEDIQRMARPHNGALKMVKNWELPTLAGAGALRSTANDMLKFVAANCGITKSPLSPALEDSQGHRTKAEIPDTDIALNWHITKKRDMELVWHSGGTGGYRSFIGFSKQKRVGVVVLSNSENAIDDIGFHLLDGQSRLTKIHKPFHVDGKALDRFTGTYELRPNLLLTLTRTDDHLFGQATGQGLFELTPIEDNTFSFDDAEIVISFAPGPKPIEEMNFVQAGAKITAKRVAASVARQKLKRPVAKVDPKIYDTYAGTYELLPNFSITFTHEGDALMAQATGQLKLEIYPESETKFFYEAVDAQIVFKKDAQGKVTEMTLFQNGAQMPGKRK